MRMENVQEAGKSGSTSAHSETSRMDASSCVLESLNQLRLEDELAHESPELFISVDNPEKHTTSFDSYITFRISTKTTRSDYDSSEYIVRRRYRDFIWLRRKLEDAHPAHLVPPLPEKHSTRLDKFTLDFLNSRMFALNQFLNRLACHPVLSNHACFKIFITAKGPEFQSYKKSQGPGIIKSIGESVHNIAASYIMKGRPEEFDDIFKYIEKFEKSTSHCDRIAARVLVERIGMGVYLSEFAPTFSLWANSETKMVRALEVMSSAVDTWYQALLKMVDDHELKLAMPLREYSLYAEAVKNVLKRRDAYQIEHELTVEELKRKRAEKDLLKDGDQTYSFGALIGKDPEEMKKVKLEKLDKQIQDLIKQSDETGDQSTCANADLRADMNRWHVNKSQDLKAIFLQMANSQLEYYKTSLKAWEDILPQIHASDGDISFLG